MVKHINSMSVSQVRMLVLVDSLVVEMVVVERD
jgi:hypothetical protein